MYSRNSSSLPSVPAQNILLLGETGAGKSTVINMIYNYYYDGKPSLNKSTIKVVIPTKYLNVTDKTYERNHSESNVKDTTKSQTTKCTTYKLRDPKKGNINIIDTPGLSDTEGFEQDEKNINIILEAAEKAENLSAIAIVVNGTNARITINMKNVLTRLQGSVPDILLDNIILILTNCDQTTSNFSISKFEEQFTRPVLTIYMQNSAFSTDPKFWDSDSLPIIEFNWARSLKSIKTMLSKLEEFKSTSTDAFKDMKQHRNKIIAILSSLLNDIKTIQDVEEKLAFSNSALKEFEGDVEKYKNFIQKTTMTTVKKVETSYHNTVCMNCVSKGIVCHEHCGLQESTSTNASLFSGCACMRGNNSCSICECGPGSHYHAREKYEKTTQPVEKVLQDIKSKFDSSQQNAKSTRNNLQTFQKDIDLLKQALVKKEQEIEKSCRDLKKICSGFNFAAELQAVIQTMEMGAQSLTSIEGVKEARSRINRLKKLVDDLSPLPSNKTLPKRQTTTVEENFDKFPLNNKESSTSQKKKDPHKKKNQSKHSNEQKKQQTSYNHNYPQHVHPHQTMNQQPNFQTPPILQPHMYYSNQQPNYQIPPTTQNQYHHTNQLPEHNVYSQSYQNQQLSFLNQSQGHQFIQTNQMANFNPTQHQQPSNFNAPANSMPHTNTPKPVPLPKSSIVTINDPKKTTCQFFIRGNCNLGGNCKFFHPSVKCSNWIQTGICKHGNYCHFLHQH